MKNFNKRDVIFLSLTLFSLNVSMAQDSSAWKKAENKRDKDCVNCYAVIDDNKKEEVYSYSDSITSPITTHNKDGYSYQLSSSDTYKKEKRVIPEPIIANENLDVKPEVKIDSSNSKNIAIQVGAFRRYAGAKIYAKKYAILSTKYNVEIVAGAKDQKPIYRVRIEGFPSRAKAKEFKRKYGLTGAFLVMR